MKAYTIRSSKNPANMDVDTSTKAVVSYCYCGFFGLNSTRDNGPDMEVKEKTEEIQTELSAT